MKLEKAIEILGIEAHLAERQPETGIFDALNLGIEATTYILKERYSNFPHHIPLLKGETED